MFGFIEADSVSGKDDRTKKTADQLDKASDSKNAEIITKEDDKTLLDAAFRSVERLFERVRAEGGTLSDAERANLYESLLLSLLKVEREHLRRALLQEERERQRHLQMRQVSLIWVFGWLMGILFYFALQSL